MIPMKRILALCLACLAALAAAAAEPLRITLDADRTVVSAGGSVMITISINRRDVRDLQLPKVQGVSWLTNRVQRQSSVSIRNGVTSEELLLTLPLLLDPSLAPGTEVTIPPIRLAVGGSSAESRPLSLRVAPRGAKSAPASGGAADPAGEPRGEVLLPAGRKSYRVGEEIPLEFRLTIPARLRVTSLEYPHLTGADGAVFADYAKRNPQNPRFAPPRELRGRDGVTIVFRTAVRFFAPVTFTPGAELTLSALVPASPRNRRDPFDDDFFGPAFGGFFDRGETRPVAVRFAPPAAPVEVRALPPLPAGTMDLRLVGDWRIAARLEPRSGRVGEPLELAVTVTGNGDAGALRAPTLRLDGFRVYPPEVKPFPGGIRVSYVMIPLRPGERTVDPRFALFDTAADRYETAGGPFTVAIAPADPAAVTPPAPAAAAAAPVAPAAKTAPPTAPPPKEETPRTELFYQAAEPGDPVLFPLWRNRIGFIVTVLAVGFAAALLIEVRERRREALAADPALRERQLRSEAAPRLLRRLRSGDVDREFLRQEVVPYLAEGFGLPPGATAGEVASRLDDPELAEYFRSLESGAFVPGGAAAEGSAAPLPAPARKRLCRTIRRLAAVALCFGLALCAGAAVSPHADFDAGRLDAAAAGYRRGAEEFRPGALYNLGNTRFRQGDYPAARAALEVAHRLAPRDPEITGNLNLVNRRLLLPEVDADGDPRELVLLCRDTFRPDEYLAAAALLLAVAAVAAALRRRIPAGVLIGVEITLGVFLALALAAAAFQCGEGGPYSRDRAVIVGRSVEIRSRPAASSGRGEATIPGGGDATILDRRGEWLRISAQGRDGWVRADEVKELFPRHE